MAELRTVNPLVAGSSPALGAMESTTPDEDYCCLDCQVDTLFIGEYYMVHAHIWAQTNLGPYDGMLCIDCLETRLQRKLSKNDFTSYPINTSSDYYRSRKLMSRLLDIYLGN